MSDQPKTQLDKFKEAAWQAECDDDETRWVENLAKIVKAKPEPEKPE